MLGDILLRTPAEHSMLAQPKGLLVKGTESKTEATRIQTKSGSSVQWRIGWAACTTA